MIRLRTSLVALLLTAVAWPLAAQQSKPLDLSYIPADAFAAAIVHPRQILATKEMELMPTEVFQAAAQKELGLDPTQIDQFVGILAINPNNPEPMFGMILRFAQPLPKDALAEQLARAEKANYNGKEYYRANVAVMFADDRTLILALEPYLKKMIDAAGADSPLLKLLKKADSGDDAQALVALEPVRPLINQALANPPPLPPPLVDLLKLPANVDHVHLRITNALQHIELALASPDAQKAAEVERIVKQAITLGKQMILAQMESEMRANPDDPVQQATMRYMRRLADYFARQVEPKRNDTKVVIASDAGYGVPGMAVMSALLLPAVQKAREAARRTQAMSQIKNIVLALHNHVAQHRRFPTNIVDKQGKPLLSWRVQILPYLEQQTLYDQFRLDEPWDSEHNRKLLARMPAILRHPHQTPDDTRCRYLGVSGKGTFFGTKDLKFADIKDGSSNTAAVVEVAPEAAVPWTKPQDWEYDPQQPQRGLFHLGAPGLNVGFADGSVHYLTEEIDVRTLKALFTIDGKETAVFRDF